VNNLSVRRKSVGRLVKSKSFYTFLVAVIAVICYVCEHGFELPYSPDFESNGTLAVCFIDVGQGDCTLIKTPSGKHMLIDAGTSDSKYKITDYLKNNGVSDIEYCVFTHPHEDHIGSAYTVIQEFNVANVLMTQKYEATAVFERLLDALKESKATKGTKVLLPTVNETYYIDEDVFFTVFSADGNNDDTNNSSIVLKLTYDSTDFLFSGDAESSIEYEILKNNLNVEAEVFKCGHHGSSTSNSEEFVKEVSPVIAIVSCGVDNSYGHPHREVVSLMNKIGADIYRTDIDGDIVLFSDGNTVNLHSTNKAA